MRCGGVRDLSYQGGVCLRGYHQNITDTVMLKDKARLRDNVLSNLCQCYYSIYLFDLDHDTEEAIWQETWIEKSREFPKGSLKLYYEKFIQGHVCHEDQEKMRREMCIRDRSRTIWQLTACLCLTGMTGCLGMRCV